MFLCIIHHKKTTTQWNPQSIQKPFAQSSEVEPSTRINMINKLCYNNIIPVLCSVRSKNSSFQNPNPEIVYAFILSLKRLHLIDPYSIKYRIYLTHPPLHLGRFTIQTYWPLAICSLARFTIISEFIDDFDAIAFNIFFHLTPPFTSWNHSFLRRWQIKKK